MKFYMQKIAVFGLVAAFAFLAGWFCTNPQGMQMPEDYSVAAMSAEMMNASYHYMNGSLHNTWSACVFNCLSKVPQTIAAKKFNVDSGAGFLLDVFDNQTTRLLADSSGLADFSKTRPPIPDTLFSVFKKE